LKWEVCTWFAIPPANKVLVVYSNHSCPSVWGVNISCPTQKHLNAFKDDSDTWMFISKANKFSFNILYVKMNAGGKIWGALLAVYIWHTSIHFWFACQRFMDIETLNNLYDPHPSSKIVTNTINRFSPDSPIFLNQYLPHLTQRTMWGIVFTLCP